MQVKATLSKGMWGQSLTKKYTLDTNCIIDLEEGRESGPYIEQLVTANSQGDIGLQVVAISASERLPNGLYATNYREFVDKLTRVGLGEIDVIKPMAYLGICFLDHSLYVGGEMANLEVGIHDILFPDLEYSYKKYCSEAGIEIGREQVMDPRWRNAKCDVQAMWSHIYHKGDVFVTGDNNFHKATKKPALIGLGAGSVLTPAEAVNSMK